VPYQVLQRPEFGTWGSALLAGFGVGIYDHLANAAEATTAREGAPMPFRADVNAQYAPLVAGYIQWQQQFSDAFRAFATAPGA
jgi:sugar (pentulose or hexulose) kinase